MLSELVRTTTRDQLKLDGALFTPAVAPTLELDACLLLHGVGSNFYGGNLFGFLTPMLLEQGLATLRVNTRGHDAISWAAAESGASRQGSAYEVVDDCRHDVAAWVNWLAARGFARVAVVGHSLGAIKAIYAQAHEPLDEVKCVIAASPPRLSYSAFRNSADSSVFLDAIHTAEQFVATGRPDALFQSGFPVPLLVAAEAYLDKYGTAERYNILRFLEQVTCPCLVTYGQRELAGRSIAFAGMDEAIAGTCGKRVAVEVISIPGADHFYSGVYEDFGRQLVHWLSTHFQ